jgi:hypothetical protein
MDILNIMPLEDKNNITDMFERGAIIHGKQKNIYELI